MTFSPCHFASLSTQITILNRRIVISFFYTTTVYQKLLLMYLSHGKKVYFLL